METKWWKKKKQRKIKYSLKVIYSLVQELTFGAPCTPPPATTMGIAVPLRRTEQSHQDAVPLYSTVGGGGGAGRGAQYPKKKKGGGGGGVWGREKKMK